MEPAALLNMRLCDVTWIAFDTEATGYSNVVARLVEVAGVRFRLLPGSGGEEPVPDTRPPEAFVEAEPADPRLAGAAPPGAAEAEAEGEGEPPAAGAPGTRAAVEVQGTFEELVNPGVAIPEEVVRIHGISNATVRDLPGPVAVLERFFAFCEGGVLLAHYVPFDLGAMTYALLREGRGVPRLFAVDTSMLPKRLFPGAPNYSLGTLVQFLGLPPAASHRAMPDAVSTMELFRRCIGAMGNPATITVGDLCRLAGAPLSFEQFVDIPPTVPPELAAIDAAIEGRQDLTLAYRGGSKGNVPRRVTPSHLFARDGALFLEAYCHLDQAAKSFRVDRIESAVLLPVDPNAPVLRNKGSGHWVREDAKAGTARPATPRGGERTPGA